MNLVFKPDCPVKGLHRMAAPGIRLQIVYKIAASDNKDSLIAQRSKPLPDLIVKLGRLRFVKAQLDHWDVGPREDMTEHGPGPMVEPPLLVTAHRDRYEQMLDATGKDRITGSWIPYVIQFL